MAIWQTIFDSNGNLVGAKNIGGSSSDIPQSITTDSSDNVLVGGGYFSNNIDIDGDGGNDLTSNDFQYNPSFFLCEHVLFPKENPPIRLASVIS